MLGILQLKSILVRTGSLPFVPQCREIRGGVRLRKTLLRHKQKGFTLVELLIYVAIVSTVVVGMIYMSIDLGKIWRKNYIGQESQANSRMVMAQISRLIRSATGVTVASSVFDTDPGRLVLTMSTASLNPTVISLDQDNGRVQVTQGAGAPVYITTNDVQVTNLQFRNLTSTSPRENIQVLLTVLSSQGGGDPYFTYTQSLETAVSVRQ